MQNLNLVTKMKNVIKTSGAVAPSSIPLPNVRVMATPLARASVDRGVEVGATWKHGEQKG